jgi:hypothetical protein
MNRTKDGVRLMALMVVVSAISVAVGASPAEAAAWCDFRDPQPYASGATTPVRPEYVWSRKIELRYNGGIRCAWGRITNGSVGDEVWVDRSSNGGQQWQQLGYRRISFGRDTYTVMFDDASPYVMRACGKAGNRPEIVCTRWY